MQTVQEKQENTQHKQTAEAGAVIAGDGGAWGHAPSPVSPNRRSATIDHSPTAHDQKRAERGRHAHQRTESSLARADHAPNSDDRREPCFRRQERTTTGNSAEGRVS
jgi:hypothetical protein